MQGGDNLGGLLRRHLHEAEAPGTACLPVHNDPGGPNRGVGADPIGQICSVVDQGRLPIYSVVTMNAHLPSQRKTI